MIVGQERVVEQFASAWASRKLHHAWLLVGPKGVGKATFAHAAARRVLAEAAGPTFSARGIDTPDDHPMVKLVEAGSHPDMRRLERLVNEKTGNLARNISVDQVRSLSELFDLSPAMSQWRVAVIDTVDELEPSGANALLKMLEEPPPNSLFFLVSHAPGRLLPTIRSRCLPLKLAPLADAALVAALDHLGISGEGGAVLSAAKGSVGEALKLLNYGGGEIIAAYDEMLSAQGPTARKAMHRLADALSGRESDTIFDFFVSHVGDDIMNRARAAASEGQITAAERLARLYSDITERLTVSDAYNLDRKQTIISILADIKQPGL